MIEADAILLRQALRTIVDPCWHDNEAYTRGALSNWNPLANDGDAFYLAFANEMSVDMYGCIIGYDEDSQYEFNNFNGDIANVRRAITEVAALIQRNKEAQQ